MNLLIEHSLYSTGTYQFFTAEKKSDWLSIVVDSIILTCVRHSCWVNLATSG